MTVTVKFSELKSNHGNINKVIDIDNPANSRTNAQIYSGTGKTIELEIAQFKEYLESLNNRPDTCMVLGVWEEGKEFLEYDITVEGRGEDPANGLIARTKARFKYANNDSVSFMLLDIDGGYTRSQISEFISDLESLLEPALVGSSASDRRHLMRFEKPSCSGGVIIKGEKKEKWHIYIPVKNASSKLVEQIFRWAWMTKFPSHKINKAAGIESRSIIDVQVANPERICFEADPEVVYSDPSIVQLVERKCDYYPGGVLDCELALDILEPLTSRWTASWHQYRMKVRNSLEFEEAQRLAELRGQTEYMTKGHTKAQAQKLARLKVKNQIILSSEELMRTDGTTVSVYDILVDRDSWNRTGYFTDPMDPVKGTNKAMVIADENIAFLNSFDHGGVKYFLKFDAKGLRDWMDNASIDELIDCFSSFASQSEISPEDMDILMSEFKKLTKVTLGTVKESVKRKKQALKVEIEKLQNESEDSERNIYVPEDASQGTIIDAYLRGLGPEMIRTHAGSLYVFDHTIWRNKKRQEVSDDLHLLFDHCARNKRVADYSAMANYILSDKPDIFVERWPVVPGIPCAGGFYQVSRNGIELVKYTKELGCRFKLGFNPDWEMKTPYWDLVLANVRNPRCFQQGFGLALSGYLTAKAQKILVAKGEGGSGKGTMNRVLTAMLPKGKVSHVGLSDMNNDKKLMSLVDSVVNIIPEIKRNSTIDTAGLKMVSGGDDMTAWKLYTGDVFFTPVASQIININDWPQLDSVGSEIARRLGDFICMFDKRQSEDVLELDAMIIEYELPGVLAWAIDGIRDYFKNGSDSEYSRQLFTEWTSTYDQFSLFVQDCIDGNVGGNSACERTGLWEVFFNYCVGRPFVRQGEFYRRLEETFGQPVKSGSVRKYKGIQLSSYGATFMGARNPNTSARRGK